MSDADLRQTFNIAKNLQIPAQFALQVLAILAKRGAGKTYAADVIAEEMLKIGMPIVVIDGMGTHWGLRVAVDENQKPITNKPGMPVVVFGGEHADLQLVPEKASLIARSIVQSGISAVIDISQLSKNKSRRIVGDFLYELYRLNKNYGTRHVFIEESDQWAPQKAPGDVAYSLGAVDEIVRRGGNFNIGCTLITQRSAVLNKDVLTQADCLIVLRTLAPQDKKAIQAWVEEMTDQRSRELAKWYDSLKELRDGEAWVWHPDKPVIFKRVVFRKRETLHATREFLRTSAGRQVKMMPVDEYIEKFRTVFEPKPKPAPAPPPKAKVIVQGPEQRSFVTPSIATPPVPQRQQIHDESVIRQDLSTYVLQRNRSTFTIPDPEPSTVLGRLLVVLMKHTDRAGNRKWTLSALREALTNHGWLVTEDELRQAITHLLQTEHLEAVVAGSRTDYRFTGRERVQIIDNPIGEAVA
jgi:hypothetical protein